MRLLVFALAALVLTCARGETQRAVDIPTRPGVTLRVALLAPPGAKAAVALLAGGNGGLEITPDGAIRSLKGNFLVRSRDRFADAGLIVAVLDAPSDHQSPPFLMGFRQTPEHAADLKAVIAWLRENYKVPVWLVGTSRGSQSVAYAATELGGSEGPDGIVLSSSILRDNKSRPVPAMPLEKIRIPVLVVHHEQDGCGLCPYSDIPSLMDKLQNSSRRELLSFKGGESRGDPCEAFAHHGYNGLEREVVPAIAAWVLGK
jgi:pimeloyl-ACP methyl ester carboxylesterase